MGGSRLPLLLALELAVPGGGGRSGTETGTRAPTPVEWMYRAPEQVADGWETASLESVGMIPAPLERLMNELQVRPGHRVHGIVKASRLPFRADTSARTIDQICHATPLPLGELRLPEELERIVRKCL